MSTRSRLVRRMGRVFLPFVLIVVVAAAIAMILIVYGITRPPRNAYLVTPQTFSQVTGPLLNATDVTWNNHDGTKARGWVIRGAEGAPGVILLHRYGADRSWLLNLAVKLNETSNFTVLWPDLRGHGENPPVNRTSFGAMEGDDVTAAIDYLQTLKTQAGKLQIGSSVGVYGVGLGGYAALDGAARYPEVRAVALDSAPSSPDDLVRAATDHWTGMSSGIFQCLLQPLAHVGIRVYSLGKFPTTTSCDLAHALGGGVRVLLLAGAQGDPARQSTLDLARCLKSPPQVKNDLTLT